MRTIGIWSIIVGIVINNISYLVDLMKDRTGVIILGDLSLSGIAIGIVITLGGMFLLLRGAVDGR